MQSFLNQVITLPGIEENYQDENGCMYLFSATGMCYSFAATKPDFCMKKKKVSLQKLSLGKETISALDYNQQNGIIGAGSNTDFASACHYSCQSECLCPESQGCAPGTQFCATAFCGPYTGGTGPGTFKLPCTITMDPQ
ncbi:class I lanthipeptide [Taibaiella helva]|uniref:class I lanthipeptide n=1 Tax=Taibaiella helva TaxID=2301235 RepID=UPI000E578C18|nr:class I lanthipeptide [Taibaiella helva]